MSLPLRASLVLSVLLLGMYAPAGAQPTPPVDTFDLVLAGQHLQGHDVALKTNPWRSNAWTTVASGTRASPCKSVSSLHVVSGLSTARFLGQDIRENYIALKITTTRSGPSGTLRAAYALPAAGSFSTASCERLAALIANDPATVRRHSLASYVRPRPVPVSTDTTFIEHLEAPVRHRKPGVMEVEWLEILFRSGS